MSMSKKLKSYLFHELKQQQQRLILLAIPNSNFFLEMGYVYVQEIKKLLIPRTKTTIFFLFLFFRFMTTTFNSTRHS